ncbi:MAG: zinc-dependent metalloprotease [Microscillaceae bacterium]|jgi:hypothetical protein|nr:zinc-dependent metalloprotease [Microscillaceae bacterium]
MIKLKLLFTALIIGVLSLQVGLAQKKSKNNTPTLPAKTNGEKKDTVKAKGKLTPYNELIGKKAQTSRGLFNVHKVSDKWYFEINDTLLGRDIMTVTRYTKTAAGGGIFGGEEINRQVVRWEKTADNRLFLRSISYVILSPDSTKPIFQSVTNSSLNPIIGAFDIKSVRKDTSMVIEVGDFFKGENQVFSLDPRTKQFYRLNALQNDRSFIQSIRSYPINTEIRTVKTFNVTPPSLVPPPIPMPGVMLPAGNDAGVVTFEINTSMIILPKSPMRKRFFDARVGYFSNQYSTFGEESQSAEKDVFAVRWRLEPKNAEDAQKQLRGELIEPQKPIVFYIDPATPVKWRKYLKQGVDDWQKAFEKAGWKNAIRGEYWNEKDSTMSLEDARFSVIRYFAADIQNAYGPNVHDPRSGEILESHIGWYHNVMRLLRDWYLIQTAACDPRAQKIEFDDELMGELIRFVSSHEVGHTLGLRHNMGASSATPVEKLRDKNFIKENGHTSSIMDYARFNYVAQPEDGITDFFPRIGDYDIWAIEWGYRYFANAKSAEEESKLLNDLTKEKVKNPRLAFGTEVSPHDPRYQTEDLSDNAMIASGYGIKNLQRIIVKLPDWTATSGKSYEDLAGLYDQVFFQYRRYLGHVIKNIGGVYDTPKTTDMSGAVYEVVPKKLQKDAVNFLNRQLFDTPTWLLNPSILNKIRPGQGAEAIKTLQEAMLNILMAGDRAWRLMEYAGNNPENYSLDNLVSDVQAGIMSELQSRKAIDIYRRNLQKVFVEKLIALLNPGSTFVNYVPPGGAYGFESRAVDLRKTDLPSVVRAHLEEILTQIRASANGFGDAMSRYHLKDLAQRIDNALNPQK